MNDEEAAFQRQLDDQPDDHTCRLVFADWLDEHGDERAEGYRALGRNRLVPRYAANERFRDFGHWICGFTTTGRPYGCVLKESWHSLLEKVWVDAPEGWHLSWGGMRTQYPTRRIAEDLAAVAFTRLPAARRAELLAGAAQVA